MKEKFLPQIQKSIREIGKKDKTLMAVKVQLNVDENQAICLSKIDFMQKLHIHYITHTHIHISAHGPIKNSA